ncbi:MAG: ABC transporter substrate-binding protein [Cypionkella sp.]
MTNSRLFFPSISVLLCCLSTALNAAPESLRRYGSTKASEHLLIRGTTDIALFDSVLLGFAQSNPSLGITYEQWGSNELYDLGVAACAGIAELADLIISSSVDQQVKLVNDGCAQPHVSYETSTLPASLNWRNEVFGITREPAVIVYNRKLVPAKDIPKSRFELIDLLRADRRYNGRVATYDIEQSGLGYLFAFVDSLQATTFGSLIEAFSQSKAVTTCCSAEIIDGVASGKYLIAYNVLGSYALARSAAEPNIGIVAPSDYTLVLSRAALIPRRARNPVMAGQLVDFMLSGAGRTALHQQFLYMDGPDLGDQDPAAMGTGTANLKPIQLSPVLLIGLDDQRRAHFISLWRGTFSRAHSDSP